MSSRVLLIFFISIVSSELHSACYYKNSSMEKKRKDCVNTFGMDWDCSRNTCVNQVQTTNLREDWKECNHKELSERNACYDKVAFNHSELRELDEATDMSGKYANASISGMYLALEMIDKSAMGDFAPCTSKKIMGLASKANLVATAAVEWISRSRLNAIKEDYENQVKEEGAYDAQMQALEHAKVEREVVIELAKIMKNAYSISTGLYATASVVAIAEIALIKSPPCSGIGPAPGAPGGVITTKGLSKLVNTSTGIAGIGLTGSSLSYKLMRSAKLQEERAKKELKQIKETILRFKTASAGYCSPEQREQISSDPECYCYNEDGSKNDNRTNSDICNNFWEGVEKSLFVPPSNYTALNKEIKKKVCVMKNGQVDRDCKCRQILDTKNENSCLKVSMNKNELRGLGTSFGIDGAVNTINALASGRYGFSDLDTSEFSKNAIKAKRFLRAELGKLAKKDALEKRKRDPLLADFRRKFLKSAYSKSDSMGKVKQSIEELAQSLRPSDEYIENAENGNIEIPAKSGITFSGSGKGSLNKKRNNDDSLGSFTEEVNHSHDFQEPDDEVVVLNTNDIEKDTGKSIFKIISKRYFITGFKKLDLIETVPDEELAESE